MSESNKTGLIIAFGAVVLLFLLFGGGMMTGWGGGGMMGGGNTGGGTSGGFNLMWFPTLLFLGLGVLLGWMIFGRKR